MRNLLTNAVFEKNSGRATSSRNRTCSLSMLPIFIAMAMVLTFLDQESYETLTLTGEMVGNALNFLIEGALIQCGSTNGNPIGLELRCSWSCTSLIRNLVRGATPRVAAEPSQQSWRREWRSEFRSSSKKGKK